MAQLLYGLPYLDVLRSLLLALMAPKALNKPQDITHLEYEENYKFAVGIHGPPPGGGRADARSIAMKYVPWTETYLP